MLRPRRALTSLPEWLVIALIVVAVGALIPVARSCIYVSANGQPMSFWECPRCHATSGVVGTEPEGSMTCNRCGHQWIVPPIGK